MFQWSEPKNIMKITPHAKTRTEGGKYTKENTNLFGVKCLSCMQQSFVESKEVLFVLRQCSNKTSYMVATKSALHSLRTTKIENTGDRSTIVVLGLNTPNPSWVNHENKLCFRNFLFCCILKWNSCNYADSGLQRMTRMKKTFVMSFTEMIKLHSNFMSVFL